MRTPLPTPLDVSRRASLALFVPVAVLAPGLAPPPFLRAPLLARIEPKRWAADARWAVVRSRYGLKECRLGEDVEIRDAGASKGKGVFALRAIEAGETLGR